MVILKNKGFKYGDYILEEISNYFSEENSLHTRVEAFYNCREQGYVLEIHDNEDYNKSICIWICAQRNSDKPMVVWEESILPKENANMFTEESYYKRCETFDTIEQASEKTINTIRYYFKI